MANDVQKDDAKIKRLRNLERIRVLPQENLKQVRDTIQELTTDKENLKALYKKYPKFCTKLEEYIQLEIDFYKTGEEHFLWVEGLPKLLEALEEYIELAGEAESLEEPDNPRYTQLREELIEKTIFIHQEVGKVILFKKIFHEKVKHIETRKARARRNLATAFRNLSQNRLGELAIKQGTISKRRAFIIIGVALSVVSLILFTWWLIYPYANKPASQEAIRINLATEIIGGLIMFVIFEFFYQRTIQANKAQQSESERIAEEAEEIKYQIDGFMKQNAVMEDELKFRMKEAEKLLDNIAELEKIVYVRE